MLLATNQMRTKKGQIKELVLKSSSGKGSYRISILERRAKARDAPRYSVAITPNTVDEADITRVTNAMRAALVELVVEKRRIVKS